jgi:hypothetical protein
MVEIRPPALCADRVRAPSQSRIHFWLCSVQCAAPIMSDPVIAPGSALLRTAGFRHSRATYLESYSCTNPCGTSVESYSCKKSRGVLPPTTPTQLGPARVPHPSVSRVWFFPARSRGGVNLATPLLHAPNVPKIGLTATGLAAELSTGFRGRRAREAAPSSPLESALAPKPGWGALPSGRFLQ